MGESMDEMQSAESESSTLLQTSASAPRRRSPASAVVSAAMLLSAVATIALLRPRRSLLPAASATSPGGAANRAASSLLSGDDGDDGVTGAGAAGAGAGGYAFAGLKTVATVNQSAAMKLQVTLAFTLGGAATDVVWNQSYAVAVEYAPVGGAGASYGLAPLWSANLTLAQTAGHGTAAGGAAAFGGNLTLLRLRPGTTYRFHVYVARLRGGGIDAGVGALAGVVEATTPKTGYPRFDLAPLATIGATGLGKATGAGGAAPGLPSWQMLTMAYKIHTRGFITQYDNNLSCSFFLPPAQCKHGGTQWAAGVKVCVTARYFEGILAIDAEGWVVWYLAAPWASDSYS